MCPYMSACPLHNSIMSAHVRETYVRCVIVCMHVRGTSKLTANCIETYAQVYDTLKDRDEVTKSSRNALKSEVIA